MIIISAVQPGLHRARQRRAQRVLFLRANWLSCFRASLMKRITCWLRSAQNFLLLRSNNACLTAEYAWTRSQKMALEIGTTQKQYEIWTEMEMVEFLVLLQASEQFQFDSP